MQEKINGFKKVTQQWGNETLSTEIDGEYARITGTNFIECRPSLRVNGMVNGYGLFNSFIGTQPVYTWTHMADLVAYDPGDEIKIYDGTSLSPDLNPFARIFGDEFENCVIWPVTINAYGNGFDYANYFNFSFNWNGSHWMANDSTTQILSVPSMNSTDTYNMHTMNFTYPFRANSCEMKVTIDSITETGTAADIDRKINIMTTILCQKIEM